MALCLLLLPRNDQWRKDRPSQKKKIQSSLGDFHAANRQRYELSPEGEDEERERERGREDKPAGRKAEQRRAVGKREE